jgi:hypothetical protein
MRVLAVLSLSVLAAAGACSSEPAPHPGSGAGGQASGCTSHTDCSAQAPICDPGTQSCVGCSPACPAGQYCEPSTAACQSGCKSSAECSGATPHCASSHQCVQCLADTDCTGTEVCSSGSCKVGCSSSKPCAPGQTCCSGACHDIGTDPSHCGECGKSCPSAPNTQIACSQGQCVITACAPGFIDCNGEQSDGCEHNEALDGACTCTPGDQQPCYTGPPGSEGVGICKGGARTCSPSGTGWGLCVGQTLPVMEQCNNGIDEDCDGVVDNVKDIDGDGWTACDGDCCELLSQCSKPSAVNPGAYEYPGNAIDDDCDPSTPDVAPAACSSSALFTGVTADHVAKAMELCQFTSDNAPLPQKKWGVVSAELVLANGGTPNANQLNNMMNWQAAIMENYGTGGIVPKSGPTMAGLSSGRMRDQNDPGWPGSPSTALGSSSQPPPAYLAAHGGQLPAAKGCSGNCPAGSGANDSINVRLRIRTPTNAQSFSYMFRFFSYEYWTYQCTQYNDFYLALLTSTAANLPADKNISFDSLNNPVSVNNGFFDVCAPKGCNTCPSGTAELAGTGMGTTGGGTVWLTTQAPIVPGETITLEFTVFDVSDQILDSLVLLDNFQWSVDPSGVTTHK